MGEGEYFYFSCFLGNYYILGALLPLPHILTELGNIQCPYLEAIEKLRGKQPAHWHLINPIFPAQYGRQCLNSVTEPASLNEAFAIARALLDCPFPAILRNALLGHPLIHLRMAFVFQRTARTLTFGERYLALSS